MRASPETVNWRALIGHRDFVRADDSLEEVHHRFAAGRQDFMAVLEGRELVGLCSRREVGTLLGARYGFALFARARIAAHLTPLPVVIRADAAVAEVLRLVAQRRDEHFFDDVLLVDARGEFLGLIHVRDLVRLQHDLLAARMEELGARHRQMEEDLRMAREVQVALLPRDFPACRSEAGRSLGFAHVFAPADGVSGDFFDVIPVAGTAAGLLVCDVMGHGVRSALVTAMVRTMVEESRSLAAEPGRFLARLNAGLGHLLQRTGDMIFVTASYAVVDAGGRRVTLAHAGHPWPVVWRARTGRAGALEGVAAIGGPALGLIPEHGYETMEIALETGDRLLLYTDGVVEAADEAGVELGLDAVCAVLEDGARRPLAEVLERVRARAVGHAGEAGVGDDLCLLGCELRG